MREDENLLLIQLKVSDLQQLIKNAVNEEPQKENKIILLKPKSEFQEVLTRKETAKFLNISLSKLDRLKNNGKLPALKIEHRVYYDSNMLWGKFWSGEFWRPSSEGYKAPF
ncbi:helix-turn-helix domain-containing protein [Flavobacterium sp. CAN_S2]|uniref:helix-turn-helix domain-containing protein n=1 Tax=Flavobacterium sp. CAN_S2 TaxID=2787726 RepID=UPI0018C91A55